MLEQQQSISSVITELRKSFQKFNTTNVYVTCYKSRVALNVIKNWTRLYKRVVNALYSEDLTLPIELLFELNVFCDSEVSKTKY